MAATWQSISKFLQERSSLGFIVITEMICDFMFYSVKQPNFKPNMKKIKSTCWLDFIGCEEWMLLQSFPLNFYITRLFKTKRSWNAASNNLEGQRPGR